MKLWKVGGIFHYRYQVGGVRVQRSTGTGIKGQAETLAMDALRDAKSLARGIIPVPTLGKLRDEWLEVHAATASAGHWRNVNTWQFHGMETVKLDRLTTDLVEVARAAHMEGRSAETANGWMRVLNLLVNWAIVREILPALPYRIKMLKAQKRPRSILPLSVVKAWLAAVDETARNPQVGTCVRLMIGLGLREGEALGARWEWIDWDSQTYTPGKTKGKEAVPVDMPAWLLDHLRTLKGDGPRLGLILPWKTLDDGTETPHPSNFSRRAIAAANAATGTLGVSAHRLRGTWITQHLRAGVPVPEVQRMARHKSRNTTLGYYEESREVQRKAQEELAKRMGLA